MIAYTFHASGNDAGGTADGGRGMSAAHSSAALCCPTYRAQLAGDGEQLLVAHLCASLHTGFPRTLLISYYIALKLSPVVLLTGPEGAGKAALASGLAAALVGTTGGQFITIGSDSWARRGSRSRACRDLHERFGLSQLAETIATAAALENAGRLFFVLLKGLARDELDLYLDTLLPLGPDGRRYLALPGCPPAERPPLPPNCRISATLHTPRADAPLDEVAFAQVGQIAFTPELHATTIVPELPPPPVGLQRIALAAFRQGRARVRSRLMAILGRGGLRRLGPSPALAAALLAGGIGISSKLRDDALAHVAASFDAEGRGLYDPANPRQNAQQAYDAQLLQRLLWRPGKHRALLRRLLAAELGPC